jgi:hypothetical protein
MPGVLQLWKLPITLTLIARANPVHPFFYHSVMACDPQANIVLATSQNAIDWEDDDLCSTITQLELVLTCAEKELLLRVDKIQQLQKDADNYRGLWMSVVDRNAAWSAASYRW